MATTPSADSQRVAEDATFRSFYDMVAPELKAQEQSPTHWQNKNNHEGRQPPHRITSQVDYLELVPPTLHIALIPSKFFLLVGIICVFVITYTLVAWNGIVVEHVYEAVGSSKRADDIVETYNTISGFVMAMVDVLFAMHTDKVLPVLQIYLHNLLYFLHGFADRCFGLTGRAHGFFLAIFPALLMMGLGNSLSGLQAAHSTVGFQSIILATDLMKDSASSTSNPTTLAAATRVVTDMILSNAIEEQTTPFTFAMDSPCGKGESSLPSGERVVPLNVHDLDTTAVIYGFVPREWNKEALTHELVPWYTYNVTYAGSFDENLQEPTDFDMTDAFNIFFHGKIMVEKAIGDAKNQNHSCSLSDGLYELDGWGESSSGSASNASAASNATSARVRQRWRRRLHVSSDSISSSSQNDGSTDDYNLEDDDSVNQWTRDANGTRICQGPVSSLYAILESISQEEELFVGNLFDTVILGLNMSFPELLDLDSTTMYLERYNITPQIAVDTMRIDVVMDASIQYGLTPEDLPCFLDQDDCDPNAQFFNTSAYMYSILSNAFCGSRNCAFLDISNTFDLQKEVGLTSFMESCEDIKYSGDFHGFYPTQCTKQRDAMFLYGIGSYIAGDEFGSVDVTYDTALPYIINPRRHVRFTFAKMYWTTRDISNEFDAECAEYDDGTTANCHGLWYQLKPSGRYLFINEDALPMTKILDSDFQAPIELVQLNAPELYVENWGQTVALERLNHSEFKTTHWDPALNETLNGDYCSMLMESYLNQIEANDYFLARPLQAMYTSAFYYLMSNAAVAQLDTSSSSGSSSSSSSTKSSTLTDPLSNIKLQGDQQIRNIRVSIPKNTFFASFGGCIFLIILAMLVLLCPTRRVEYFPPMTAKAQEYLNMSNEETYPSPVFEKAVVLPAVNEQIPMDNLEVERLTLMHKDQRGLSIQI